MQPKATTPTATASTTDPSRQRCPSRPARSGRHSASPRIRTNYVDLGNPPGLKFTNAITISAWSTPPRHPPRKLESHPRQVGTGLTGPRIGPGLLRPLDRERRDGLAGHAQIFAAEQRGGQRAARDGGMIPLNGLEPRRDDLYRSPTDVTSPSRQLLFAGRSPSGTSRSSLLTSVC